MFSNSNLTPQDAHVVVQRRNILADSITDKKRHDAECRTVLKIKV